MDGEPSSAAAFPHRAGAGLAAPIRTLAPVQPDPTAAPATASPSPVPAQTATTPPVASSVAMLNGVPVSEVGALELNLNGRACPEVTDRQSSAQQHGDGYRS